MSLSDFWVEVVKPQANDNPESYTLPNSPIREGEERKKEVELKRDEIEDEVDIFCIETESTSTRMCELTCYWEGYSEAGINPYPLNEVPDSVKYITIAFVQPVVASNNAKRKFRNIKKILFGNKKTEQSKDQATTWAFDSTFVYSTQQIKQWIQEINARETGQKVLFSLLDTPDVHWYPNVNIPEFAKNVAATVKEWNLGGVDIDAESGMDDSQYVASFVQLISCLREEMGPNKLIIYTCYTESDFDQQILAQTKDKINILNTMAYWDDLSGMQQLFNHYAKQIGNPNKVGLGVKAGDQNNDPSTTPLNTVRSVAQWLKSSGYKRMMLWSLTRDVKSITHQNNEQWLHTMLTNLE